MYAFVPTMLVLSQFNTFFPKLKDTLRLKGLSIQAQHCYPLRTAVDERGEQTVNRDEKISGIRNIGSSSSILKWSLNR